jgi:enolase-phosphatase E1
LGVLADSQATKVVLLDIEGTTTPVEFVLDVLFPYARNHVREFLRRNPDAAQGDVEQLRKDHAADRSQNLNPPDWGEEPSGRSLDSIVAYVHWLIDRDRKSKALKSLQGKIWELGYRNGELRGEIYPDVSPALTRWSEQGKRICIFSSGSVLAQKLLFGHTVEGDLTPFIADYFDTQVGPKTAASSYRQIAGKLQVARTEILFVSDVTAELDAAQSAGLHPVLCVRPARPGLGPSPYPVIHGFDEIFPPGLKS